MHFFSIQQKFGPFLLHIFLSFKISSYYFHNVMDVALDYTTQMHLFSHFLDITFIVFHSMNSLSRFWMLLRDKYHGDEKMVQCQCYFRDAGTSPQQCFLLLITALGSKHYFSFKKCSGTTVAFSWKVIFTSIWIYSMLFSFSNSLQINNVLSFLEHL